MSKRGVGERNWQPPATGITSNRWLQERSEEQPLPKQKLKRNITRDIRTLTLQVEQLEVGPALLEVVHVESGHSWTVAEGADGTFDIIGDTEIPQIRGLTAKSIIYAAKKRTTEA